MKFEFTRSWISMPKLLRNNLYAVLIGVSLHYLHCAYLNHYVLQEESADRGDQILNANAGFLIQIGSTQYLK